MSWEDLQIFANTDAPSRRRLYIYRDPPATEVGVTSGWCFVSESVLPDGTAEPIFDTWEERFTDIVGYPPLYASGPLQWRDIETGATVSLAALIERFR